MNRRLFLTRLGALIGGLAIDAAVPSGVLYSFPKNIVCMNRTLCWEDISAMTSRFIVPRMFDEVFKNSPIFLRLTSGRQEFHNPRPGLETA